MRTASCGASQPGVPLPSASATVFTVELHDEHRRVERCDPDGGCRSIEHLGPLTDAAFAPRFAAPLRGEPRAVTSLHQVEHAQLVQALDALRTLGITRYTIEPSEHLGR